jgi:hypothetical protein
MAVLRDLTTSEFPTLDWKDAEVLPSLDKLRGFAVARAVEASTWYATNRRWKRRNGQLIRLLAMAATTAAGLMPILSQIFTQNGQPSIPPAWSTVALAIAAGLVSLDYFFGFSSSWSRFVETDQKIIHALREFQFDWEALRASWGATVPANPQVLAAMTRVKQFGLLVQQIVQDETAAWITDFRTNLKLIDDAARAKLEPPARPGMNVTVTNGTQVTGAWTLSVDDGTPTSHRGGRAALVNLAPGPRKLHAEGTIDGKTLRDEKTVPVPSTGIGEATLTLG